MLSYSIKKTTLLASLITIIGFLITPAFAERIDSSCKTYNSYDQEIRKTTGSYFSVTGKYYGTKISLDTPSYYWRQGTWFIIPLGYQNPWPSDEALLYATDKNKYKQRLGQLKENTGFDPDTENYNPDLVTKQFSGKRFAFWMPSKRYVERDRRKSVDMRPCEAGREFPKDNEYVVSFQMELAFLNDSKLSSATRRFSEAAKDLKKTGRVRGQNLTRNDHSRNGPISGERRFQIYEDDGDLVVMLRGWPFLGPEAPINPICDGHVWERSSNLLLYIKIAGDQCQLGNEKRWHLPVRAAIDQAKQWRIKGSGE